MENLKPSSLEDYQTQQQQAQENEERRVMILDQILEPQAKERLNRIRLVKGDKVRAVEDSLIMAAKSGKLKSKVTDEYLITMLEQVGGSSVDIGGSGAPKVKGITIQRRKYGFDDEDDDDSDLI